jgi:hypothetical protein
VLELADTRTNTMEIFTSVDKYHRKAHHIKTRVFSILHILYSMNFANARFIAIPSTIWYRC